MQRQDSHQNASKQNIKTLFKYIQKNTALKNKLTKDYYKQNRKEIKILLAEIECGNHQSKVYDHPEVMVFLLHLIKKQEISFLQGMTNYAYMMAYGQYRKDRSNVSIKYLDPIGENTIYCEATELEDGACLSDIGEKYIEFLCKQFNKIDKKYIRETIKKLPESEKWLITLDYDNSNVMKSFYEERRSSEMLLYILSSKNNGFIMREQNKMRARAYMPSFSLIQSILEKQYDKPVEMRFGFGRVGNKTLYKMHQKNRHPIPLYHPDVKSNLMSVHGYHCGGFLAMMHDVGHSLWASRMNYYDRQYVLRTVIPALRILLKNNKQYQFELAGYIQGQSTRNLLSSIQVYLNDFNLVDVKSELSLGDYLQYAMYSAIKEQAKEDLEHVNKAVIGVSVADKLYFLIKLALNNSVNMDQEYKAFLKEMLNKLHDSEHQLSRSCRSLLRVIFSTPEVLRYQDLSEREKYKIKTCNLVQWIDLFKKYQNNFTALWEKITEDRSIYSEYKVLCQNMGFKFLPGVFEMSSARLEIYKGLFQNLLETKPETNKKRSLPEMFDRETYKKPRMAITQHTQDSMSKLGF